MHPYIYCANDPINYIDPMGLHMIVVTGTGDENKNIFPAYLYDDNGNLVWEFHVGRLAATSAQPLPPGDYYLGSPIFTNDIRMWPIFYPILYNDPVTGLTQYGRYGLHGGRFSYALQGRLMRTHGCIRMSPWDIWTLQQYLSGHTFRGDVRLRVLPSIEWPIPPSEFAPPDKTKTRERKPKGAIRRERSEFYGGAPHYHPPYIEYYLIRIIIVEEETIVIYEPVYPEELIIAYE